MVYLIFVQVYTLFDIFIPKRTFEVSELYSFEIFFLTSL